MVVDNKRLSALAALLFTLNPFSVASAANSTIAFIANAGNNNIQVVDLASGQTLTKLYTGATPWRLLLSPDKKELWVQHWYAEKTVAVDLAKHQIRGIINARGPGLFNQTGDRFWSFSWPGGKLRSYDTRSLEPKETKESEAKHPFSIAFSAGDRKLYIGQYDPVTKVKRPLYDYVLPYSMKKGESTVPLQTGDSTIRLRADPTNQFMLAANADGQEITLINRHDALAKVSLFPGPRDVLFVPNSNRMIVLGWSEHEPESDIALIDMNWKHRPWPEVKPIKQAKFLGGLVAGQIDPSGKVFYALDRTHGRLITFDAKTLEQISEIKVGDIPYDFVITKANDKQREGWKAKRPAIKRLEEIIAKVKAGGEPYYDMQFVETMQPKAKSEQPELAKKMAGMPKKVISTMFKSPDSMRQEFEGGAQRLAQGGKAYTITPQGQFFDQPRQDLMSAIYALHALPVDEVIRQLAGDVPGGAFLKNGIAVDIVTEIKEDGHIYHVIGAQKSGDEVSQLWIRDEDSLPVDLVEKIPVFVTRSPHMESPPKSTAETKFVYEKVQGKYQVPTKMIRIIDGKEVGEVRLSEIKINSGLKPELFDLVQLGGLGNRPPRKDLAKTSAASDGPGLAVPGLGNQRIDHPMLQHIPYNSEPPTSGPHVSYRINWGVHRTPIAPEVQLRHLEEGGVLLQYNCVDGCSDLVAKLEGLAKNYGRLIVAPYPLMKSKLAITAWERLDTLDTFDEKRIKSFIEAYMGTTHFPAEQFDEDDSGEGELMMPHHKSVPGMGGMSPH